MNETKPGSIGARIGYMVAEIEVERDEFARALYAICLASKEPDNFMLNAEIEKAKDIITKYAPRCLAEKVR